KLAFTPLHCFYNRGDLHKVRSRADNVDHFNHVSCFKFQVSSFKFPTDSNLKPGTWNFLKANYPRAAVASDLAVKRIPRIHYQRTKLANSMVVSLAMVGDNHHAVAGTQFFIG